MYFQNAPSYYLSFLVLKSSESRLVYFCCVLNVMSLLSSLTLIRSAIGWSVVHVCDVAFPGHTHLLFQYLLAHMITRLLKGPK